MSSFASGACAGRLPWIIDVTHGLPTSSPVAADDALALALALALAADELAEPLELWPHATSTKAIANARATADVLLISFTQAPSSPLRKLLRLL